MSGTETAGTETSGTELSRDWNVWDWTVFPVPGRFSPRRFSPKTFQSRTFQSWDVSVPGWFSPKTEMVIFFTIISISLLHALCDSKLTNHHSKFQSQMFQSRDGSVPECYIPEMVMVIFFTIISSSPVIWWWVKLPSLGLKHLGLKFRMMVCQFTITQCL